MNYSIVFTIAARTKRTYNAAQSFIAKECPVLEQRLQSAALTTAVNALTIALTVIDFTAAQLEKAPEYRLQAQLAYANVKRWFVRRAISAARLDERYQVSATASRYWTRKGAIAQSALDKVFCLEV